MKPPSLFGSSSLSSRSRPLSAAVGRAPHLAPPPFRPASGAVFEASLQASPFGGAQTGLFIGYGGADFMIGFGGRVDEPGTDRGETSMSLEHELFNLHAEPRHAGRILPLPST